MKLREIDEKLYESSLAKNLIKFTNAATAARKLGKDGIEQSALAFIKNNLPDFLGKVSDNIAQNKRRRNRPTDNQDRSNQQDPEIR